MKAIFFALPIVLLSGIARAEPTLPARTERDIRLDALKADRKGDALRQADETKARSWDRDADGKRPWDRPAVSAPQK